MKLKSLNTRRGFHESLLLQSLRIKDPGVHNVSRVRVELYTTQNRTMLQVILHVSFMQILNFPRALLNYRKIRDRLSSTPTTLPEVLPAIW